MNKYTAMRKRQQEEVNALPLGAAFSPQQFEEMMGNWGLNPETDQDKILSMGFGMFFRKSDEQLVKGTFNRHHEELEAAIAEDTTGEGFITDMFVTEMNNHEYSYTGDLEDTLDALGMTYDKLVSDERFMRAFKKAHKIVMGGAE